MGLLFSLTGMISKTVLNWHWNIHQIKKIMGYFNHS